MRDEAELTRQAAETQAMTAALPALAAELATLAANEAPMDQATRQRAEGLLAQIDSYATPAHCCLSVAVLTLL
jgi:hypothetical protein